MSKTTWVRFKSSGVPHGFAYLADAVVELPEKDADYLMTKAAVAVPAKADEIEAAKVKIEAETTALAAKSAGQIDPEKIAMAKQIADLEAKLNAAVGKK